MVQKEVVAKVPGKDGQESIECAVVINYAEDVNEALRMFGEDAILTNAFNNWRVTLQSNIRSQIKRGLSCEQIQDALGSAKMGVTTTGGRVDAQTAFIAKFKTATPEKQAEMLQLLQEAAEA